MAPETFETDYLIIGAGAMGMAFADIILTESDKSVLIVDMHQKPGGHWNDAYPFVTLHQPSAYYGVSSKELSKGIVDTIGLNKGLQDLATGPEIMAYFDEVMRYQFLPTGRVTYLPMCKYEGDGKISALTSDKTYSVKAREKIVDATWLKTTVPSTHTPNFEVAEGVAFMPLNDLPKITQPPSGFVIIGGGKTGIDACLWLLENKVDPNKITWIVSRDAWLLDRENTQPTPEFFEASIGNIAAQFEAISQSESIPDLFAKLETAGVLLRIDPKVQPKMFHGATVSQLELAALRKIKRVIRLGRVQHIGLDTITLTEGSIPTTTNHVHIDCSASAISNLEIKPVFAGNTITPQTVRSYQPVFSAAFIAHVEAAYSTEEEKNELCTVVPLPNHDTDWIKMLAVFMMNQYRWSQDKELRKWLLYNRLDGFSQLMYKVDKEDEVKQAIIKRMRDNLMPAVMKLQQYVSEIG